jgi:parvulin-like peptidyl-prolyl isomerase
MFEELLVLSRADQLDITVTANDVTESVNRMRKAQQLENDEQFEAALAQAGLTPEMLRAQFESQLRFQRVIGREVWGQIQLEEEDLRRYYRDHIDEFKTPEQVKLREVVVLDDTGVSPSAASTADTLAAALAGGKSLEEAIAALPAGTVSSIIQLGWVEQGDLDPALEKAAWGLAPNAWSAPTRARGGIHLVQLLERREATIPVFKDVEAQIRQRQERAALDERMEGYLAELEKKSYLYLDPPPQAAGFRANVEGAGGRDFPFVVPSETADAEDGGKGGKGKGKKDAAVSTVEAAADRDAAVDTAAEAAVERAVEEEAQEEGGDPAVEEEIEEWPPKPQTAQPVPLPPSEEPAPPSAPDTGDAAPSDTTDPAPSDPP